MTNVPQYLLKVAGTNDIDRSNAPSFGSQNRTCHHSSCIGGPAPRMLELWKREWCFHVFFIFFIFYFFIIPLFFHCLISPAQLECTLYLSLSKLNWSITVTYFLSHLFLFAVFLFFLIQNRTGVLFDIYFVRFLL